MGSNDEDAALAAGISDELIYRLRRIPDLRVASGQDGREPEGNALRGSLRRDGDSLRVSARLESEAGDVLWSDNFNRRLTDLLAVQEEIATSVARALSVSLDVGVDSREYGGTDNPEAFANFIQGRVNLVSPDASARTRYFERAVALDPDYVRAWAGLATAFGVNLTPLAAKEDIDRTLRQVEIASTRAFDANPDLYWGNASRAEFLLISGDVATADRFIQRAEKLDPGNDPEVKRSLATLEFNLGRLDTANRLAEESSLIDPVAGSAEPQHVRELLYSRRYAESLQLYEKLRAQGHPSNVYNAIQAFWAKRYMEGDEAAIRYLRKVRGEDYLRFLEEYAAYRPLLAMSLPETRTWARRKFVEGGRLSIAHTAFHAAYEGRRAAALRLIRVAYEHQGAATYYFLWHPSLAEVRKTEGFRALVEDLGLVKAWRESGDWGDFCRPTSETEFSCS